MEQPNVAAFGSRDPGPKHVLELADPLGLSAAQRKTTMDLISAMSAEAITAGTEVIALEANLEKHFANGQATHENVQHIVDRIGATQARLRTTHLKYHVIMREQMTAEQITRYALPRGYQPTK